MVEFYKDNLQEYKKYSKKFLPKKINVLFLAESPPFPKKDIKSYFYFSEYLPQRDLLFQLIIKVIYDYNFRQDDNKIKYLNMLKKDGYYLVDSINYPIDLDKNGNKVNDVEKNNVIEEGKVEFIKGLEKMDVYKNTKIILIKENIYRIYNNFLSEKGFCVINEDKINFPFWYDYDFINEIRYLLNFKNVGILYCFKKLMKYSRDAINSINSNRIEDIRTFALFEITMALIDYGESILLLVKNSKILSANVLGRSILEAWITIKWILEDDSKINALKFYINNFELRKDKAKYLNAISNEDIDRINDNERIFIEMASNEFNIEVNYEDDINELKNYPKYKKIAESASLLEYYNTVYKYLSDYTHIGSVTTGEYFENGYEIKQDIPRDYKDLIMIISAIYFYVLDNIDKHLGIKNIKKIEKVNKYFNYFSKG